MSPAEILAVILTVWGIMSFIGSLIMSIIVVADNKGLQIFRILTLPCFQQTKEHTTILGKIATILLDVLLYPGYIVMFVIFFIAWICVLLFVKKSSRENFLDF